MMSNCRLVWLIALTVSFTSATECAGFNNQQNVTLNCLGGNLNDRSCNLTKHINSFTNILLADKEIRLNETLSFASLENVSIIGHGSNTVIDCQSEISTMIVFRNMTNLCLQKVTFRQCGGCIQLSNSFQNSILRSFFGVIIIMDTTNIFLKNVVVDQSNGSGMYLGKVSGSVLITDSNFTQNPQNQTCCINKSRCGGGIYIDQMQSKKPAKITNIVIEKCIFTDNNIDYSTTKIDRRYTNHGGGLYVSIKAPSNRFEIYNSIFTNNRAGHGGGMSITISNCSYNTTIIIANSNFSNNAVKGTFVQSGGGLLLNFEPPLSEYECTNSKSEVTLDGVHFKRNTGWMGGGLAITGFCQQQVKLTVRNSYWIENQARSGAGVAIFRSLKDQGKCYSTSPSIEFNSCTFEENLNRNIIPNESEPFYLEGWTGPGIFFVMYFDIIFSGNNTFRSNTNSALSSMNCILCFKNTTTNFLNNTGQRGGAIYLQGLSYIDVKNANLLFEDNNATKRGGAIHSHLVVEAMIVSAASCFIQNSDTAPPSEWNSTLTFCNNCAKNAGHSIYVTSLLPCQIAYGIKKRMILNVTQILNETNVFIFEGSSFNEQVSTSAASIEISKDHDIGFPGEQYKMPFTMKDNLDRSVQHVNVEFQMSFNNQANTMTQISNKKTIKLMAGSNDKKINILIKSTRNPHISKKASVMLNDCPLGYKLKNFICECIIDGHGGPVQCIRQNYSIKIDKGHFVGVIDGIIVTSFCPALFCSNMETDVLFKDEKHLEKHMCSENRQGMLCGECVKGFTTYYNSPNFLCKKETSSCDFGWLYYILSTILPLTLIFITVTAFDVNLTIGSLRGFLLFCQVVIILDWDSGKKSYEITRIIWKMIYDIFRLRFFYIDHFSFCLKRKATTLDVLSFQYLATAYAILLVCGSLFLLSHCTIHFNRFCSCIRFTTFKHSFVTGMSALLILCYGSMATISMNILNTVTLYDHNRKAHGKTRVNLQGDYVYFSSKHLPHALPALLFFSTIILTPIIMFLSCPLINKCFDYFKFTNSNPASRIASQCYLGGKLKPFYDTFQGCFKEKVQFFAGMYFLYQIMVIISKIYPTTRDQTFFHTSVTLVIIFAIHALVQPYKERLHNIIDALLFTNLIIINSLSYYIYLAEQHPDAHFNALAASIIKTILIFSPLITFSVVILKSICKRFSCYKRVQKNYELQRNYKGYELSWETSDSAYGTIKSYDDESDELIRKRQLSLSSFIAHEQTVSPNSIEN